MEGKVDVDKNVEKHRSTDRVFVLEVMEGKTGKSAGGLLDNRLFTEENKLHAIQNPSSCLWYLKYEQGIVPEPLRQQFTNFNALHKYVEGYFNKRNVNIKEVIS